VSPKSAATAGPDKHITIAVAGTTKKDAYFTEN
jgi:hypothetical protein